MTKKEFWNKLWIPVDKKLPPDTKDFILVSNLNTGQLWWSVAFQTRAQLINKQRIMKGQKEKCGWVNDHHLITHWMKPLLPEE